MGNEAELDSAAFIACYPPETEVMSPGGKIATLGFVQHAESMFCTAKPADRYDEQKRIGFYARLLAGAGSLLLEHEQYLPEDNHEPGTA